MQDRLVSQALAPLQQHLERLDLEIGDPERAWKRVEDQHHFRADEERARLRPILHGLYRERDALLRQIGVEEEREQLANELVPFHAQGTARAASIVEAIRRSVELPSREVLTELAIISREVESQRRHIHDVTGDTRYAKSVDYIDLVRFHWFEQNSAREKLLRIITSPGHRPRRSEPAPWDGAVARLTELRTAKEEAHAGVR